MSSALLMDSEDEAAFASDMKKYRPRLVEDLRKYHRTSLYKDDDADG